MYTNPSPSHLEPGLPALLLSSRTYALFKLDHTCVVGGLQVFAQHKQ